MKNSKNIIIVVDIPVFKGNTAASARLRNYAKALALDDNEVLICSAISYNQIDINNQVEVQQNIFELYQKPSKSKFSWINKNKNIAFLLRFFRNINKLIKSKKTKSVVFLYPSANTSFEILCLFYLKLFKKRKVYYEANEVRKYKLYNIIYSKNFTRKIIQFIYLKKAGIEYQFAEIITRYYDGIIAISTNINGYFHKFNKNIIRIPILSDTSIKQFNKPPSHNSDDYFNICFTGSIDLKKEGFDILFQALSDLKKRNYKIRLHLYGSFSKSAKNILLNILAKKMNIESDIIYHGIINSEILIFEMQKYQLLILTRPNTYQAKYGFSTKLSEYLISGVPVLLTDVSDNAYYVKNNINGYLIPPGDSCAIREKISEIIQNYNERVDDIVNNAFDTAKKEFHYANYSKILSQFLD